MPLQKVCYIVSLSLFGNGNVRRPNRCIVTLLSLKLKFWPTFHINSRIFPEAKRWTYCDLCTV